MLPFWATLSKQRSTLLDEISTQNSFDIVAVFGNKVERCFDIVAKNGNNVKTTFDIVAFDNVVSTLLLVWTGLKFTAPETISRSRDILGAHQKLNGSRDLTTLLSKMICHAIVWRCLRDPTFSRFGTIPACDRQTDR